MNNPSSALHKQYSEMPPTTIVIISRYNFQLRSDSLKSPSPVHWCLALERCHLGQEDPSPNETMFWPSIASWYISWAPCTPGIKFGKLTRKPSSQWKKKRKGSEKERKYKSCLPPLPLVCETAILPVNLHFVGERGWLNNSTTRLGSAKFHTHALFQWTVWIEIQSQ
jgi:hypothetical protein